MRTQPTMTRDASKSSNQLRSKLTGTGRIFQATTTKTANLKLSKRNTGTLFVSVFLFPAMRPARPHAYNCFVYYYFSSLCGGAASVLWTTTHLKNINFFLTSWRALIRLCKQQLIYVYVVWRHYTDARAHPTVLLLFYLLFVCCLFGLLNFCWCWWLICF